MTAPFTVAAKAESFRFAAIVAEHGAFLARADAFIFRAAGAQTVGTTNLLGNIGCMSASPVACCAGVAYKRTTEQKPIIIDWSPRVGDGWMLQSVTHTILMVDKTAASDPEDLSIALDGNNEPMERVTRDRKITTVIVDEGRDGEQYRLTAAAVFKDCEGFQITLEECVVVNVSDC